MPSAPAVTTTGEPSNPRHAPHTSHGFRAFAERVAHSLGAPWAFAAAVSAVLLWAITGPAFHFSTTWQMVINTGTTIVTFLMVFLLQNTQMRDSHALHLKLDELLRAVREARTGLVGLEEFSDEQLQRLSREFASLAEQERYGEDVLDAPIPDTTPGTAP